MWQTNDLQELQTICRRVRRHIVEMTGAAKSGHPGGSLSAVEILVTLYWGVMRHNPADPALPDRDRFILSKGHAAPVLYAVMAESGYCPVDELKSLRKLGSPFQGHPDRRFLPSLEASTGSLGQGLSLALGMGAAARLDKASWRTYVVLGDGECQEGQIWEAAMFGAHHHIANVCAVVDYNKIQLDGFVKDVMDLEPFAAKWASFGWNVLEVDGHDLGALQNAFGGAAACTGVPSVVIAHTVKGKGVSFMENNPKYHGTAPSAKEMEIALKELA